MPQPERVFLDWSQPTASAAAYWLIGTAPGRCVDLSDTLVLVPTRQAARRLRQELANAAPSGVLSPETLTPSQFLRPDADDIADPAEAIAVFLDAFAKFDPSALAALFPNGIPFRTFEERAHFARTFFDLRATLTDANWTLHAAAQRLGDHPDFERWEALAALDQAYLAALRRRGRRDRETARLELAAAPRLPGNIRRVVIAGIADLTPLAERTLRALPENISLHILVAAPAGLAAAFDALGRPLQPWHDRHPGWENFDAQVHLCARSEDVSSTLAAILPANTKPDPAFLEIGALDRELLPALRVPIESAGGILHDPEGRPLDRHWLGRLLGDWAGFLAGPSFNAAADFLRNGMVVAWLSKKLRGFDLDEALAEADKIRADHFPSTAESALPRCRQGRSLDRALGLLLDARARMRGRSWIESLRAFLDEISDGESRDAAAAIAAILDSIESIAAGHPDIRPSDWLHLVQSLLARQLLYADADPGAIEASGWLELPWSDVPHLVLAGFNQGIVPARFAQDPFLTGAIRQRLELPTEEQRGARDAYFLSRLLAMRRGGGRVDVLVCQIDSQGAPGQPSPLLFSGSGDELPARVRRLFAEPRPAQPDPPWEAPWQFAPARVELKKRLRVTGFRDYLACPFEFYLRFGLEMESFDPAPAEMDARVFGSLIHDTIEKFSKDAATRDLTDAGDICAAVSRILDETAEARFETPFSLPLLVQVESARQRLTAFAEAQAAQRREGWRIIHVEITFFDYLGERPWLLDGWEISGKIDRIDFHEATGRWRVLDYKTADKPSAPDKAHLRGGAERDWPPGYARVEPLSKSWTNLQLPLYRQLLVETGLGTVSCGYFNLPRMPGEAGVSEWPDFDDALGESALCCARGVLADVGRGRFWPPNPRAAWPQNADWFHPGPERTVARDSWLREVPA